MTSLPLTLEKRYSVLLPPTAIIRILLVGVGGTGSWLALSLGRLAYHARQKGITFHLTFIDPDRLENKNIGRQAYAPIEMGLNKAETMAWRQNLALGLDISAISAPFTLEVGKTWYTPHAPEASQLIIGAVDNHLARRAIAQFVTEMRGRVWWLDGGNARSNGQVLIGNLAEKKQFQVDAMGLCRGLPLPSIQEPGLLEPDPAPQPLACAEMAEREEQSLLVNAQVAAIAGQYVADFSLKRRLEQYATYFNLEPPVMVSHRLTESRVEQLARGWSQS